MDESDIIYVDSRNADHRTQHSGTPWRPAPPVRTMVAQPARFYTQPQMAPQVIYAQSPSTGANLLGRITGGQIVDLVAQIFAALMPLPGAPVATADAGTDVGN